MIRVQRLSASTEDFAAERRDILTRTETRLESAVRRSLTRLGLPGWEDEAVAMAVDIFDETASFESDAWGQVLDDLRAEFQRELREAISKTKGAADFEAQVETVTRWLSVMSINAGTEAAATADPDSNVGLEWVTMSDSDVRETHRDANGQTVPTGQPFSVGEAEMLYPGQPVGDPSNWINCRCMARPTMLSELSVDQQTFAADSHVAAKPGNASDPGVEEGEEPRAAVVVLLPREGDRVAEIASGVHPHMTLLYLGDGTVDLTPLLAEVEAYAGLVGHPITDKVSGRGMLGEDKADVLLMDATGSSLVRGGLMESDGVLELLGMQEQYPAWIPHVTLGYPESPSTGDELPGDVTFDRIAVWRGNEQYEFPLDGNLQTEESEPMPENLTAAADEDEENPHLEEEVTPEAAEDIDQSVEESENEWEETQKLEEEGGFDLIPIHGVLAPEGKPSGDGRMFSEGALTHRPLPITMKYMWEDDEGHKGSYPVAKIEKMVRRDGLVYFGGTMDNSPAAYEAVRVIANEIMNGVSVDVDSAEAVMGDEDSIEFSAARISAATICSIPAFAEAYVTLGPLELEEGDEVQESDAPDDGGAEQLSGETGEFDIPPTKTKDGPGWITEPGATKQITGYWVDGRGAAKINWGAPGDFNRCRTQLGKYVTNPDWLAGLCANLHYRALGAWPGKASGGAIEMTQNIAASAAVNFVDEEVVELSAEMFKNPELEGPTPFTVTEDGHVFGHLATWDVCHIGVADACKTAPHSSTNYAYFLTGQVFTDQGPVAVGQITMGGGHANLRYGVKPAIAHYDSTSTAVADVTVGEDSFGIWVAGALREGLSEADVRALRAAAISGDWRGVRRTNGELNAELVAALAVNVPGFPIPRASMATEGTEMTSLVAAAIPQAGDAVVDDDVIEAGIEKYFAKRERAAKADTARSRIRSFRAARAKLNLKTH